MLSFCLAASRSASVSITDLCLRVSAHTAPPPCLPHSAGTGRCGLDSTQFHCCACDKARQNLQSNWKSGMHPPATINWPPFRSKANWSLFRTVAQMYKSQVTGTYHHPSPLAPVSPRRNISHSQVYPSKSRYQDDDDDLDQVMSQFGSNYREGGEPEGRVKRHLNPSKLKQLRFTRHVVNLIRKGKVGSSLPPPPPPLPPHPPHTRTHVKPPNTDNTVRCYM